MEIKTINREISWLSFNHRVLQESQDESVPLLERLVFLGIFSNNLDEFFRVRVATIKRLTTLGKKGKKGYEDDPEIILEQIHKIVSFQQKQFEKTYRKIIKSLSIENIHLVDETKLDKKQKRFVRKYFHDVVRPFIGPIMLDQLDHFPKLEDKNIYLVIKLTKGLKRKYYSLVKIPTDTLSRFVVLPSRGDRNFIILLDDVIRYSLPEIFPSFSFDKAEAYTLKITRDAELNIDNDVNQSFLENMSSSLKQRLTGDPVRFVYDEDMPSDLLRFIIEKMKIKKYDQVLPGGRYHNFKDFIQFPRVGSKKLKYQLSPVLDHPVFEKHKSLFDAIRKRDVLLHYPYHSFNYFTNLIREAAIDPNVISIKMTAYRLASRSQVADALINAVNNGKKVSLFIELKARFDEKANIDWATALEEEGVHVDYGIDGYKIHAKLLQIARKEKVGTTYYTCVSTGNFNESTAKIYGDHALFTSDKKTGISVKKVFQIMEKKKIEGKFSDLLVSPLNFRETFQSLVNEEINKVKSGAKGEIILKLNNLVDRDVINSLYEASQVGVKIKLNIRGVNSLIPGVKGMSENIKAISIVDKYLEHSRIFIFGKGKTAKVFLSSADLMKRNLDHRVEVALEIKDVQIKLELSKFMDLQWKDNVKSRKWEELLENNYLINEKKEFRSQEEIYSWLNSYRLK